MEMTFTTTETSFGDWSEDDTVAHTVDFSGAEFGRAVDNPAKKHVKDLGHLADIRQPRSVSQTTDQIFQNLIDVILNAKKDITRINGLDDYETAKEYARKNNYRIGKEDSDINHDGVPDIVLYNKEGKPVIVNGYKLSPSKQPIRKMYQAAKRKGELADPSQGMKGFVNQLYGVESEFDLDTGERTVRYKRNELPPALVNLKANKWAIPTAPASKLGIHQFIKRLIQNAYKVHFRDNVFKKINKLWFSGCCVPRFKVFELLYLNCIDRHTWINLPAVHRNKILTDAEGDPRRAYKLFKQFKSTNRTQLNNFLQGNLANIKGINYYHELDLILTNIGITAKLVGELPYQDNHIKLAEGEEKERLDRQKKSLKAQFDTAADRYKEHLIDNIFRPVEPAAAE